MLRPVLVVIAASLSAAPGLVAGARAEEAQCYTDWSDAAPIVKAEGLLTVGALSAAARGHVGGDIVKTTLCKEGGRYVYRLVVRNAKGEVSNLTVDARTPFAR